MRERMWLQYRFGPQSSTKSPVVRRMGGWEKNEFEIFMCGICFSHKRETNGVSCQLQKCLFKTFSFKNSMVCQLTSVPHVFCGWKHNFCAENKDGGCLCRSKPKRKSALWLDRMWNSVLLAVFLAGKCNNLSGSYVEKWNFPKWDKWSIYSFLSVQYMIFSVCQADNKLSSRIPFKWVKRR